MLKAFYSLSLPLVGNFSQVLLKASSGYCEKCKKDRIRVITDYFFDKNDKGLCKRCLFTAKMFSHILNLGKSSLTISLDDLEEYFGKKNVRKGLYALLKTIETFGISKPIKTSFPLLVVWNYTDNCNLRCKHCYQNAGRKSKELNTKQRKRVIDVLSDAGVISLAFSGGEPLMEKDFFEVARYAIKKDLYVAIATNGTLITPKIAKKIRDIGIEYVEISLDGANAKTHDRFRGVPGSFERSVKALKYCLDAGLFTCLATTLNKDNFKQIPKIKRLAQKIGVKRFLVFNFVPVGRGVDIIDRDANPKEREIILRDLSKWLMEGKIEVGATAPQFARVCLETCNRAVSAHFNALPNMDSSALKFIAEFIGGCGAGRVYCAIQPNGDITPCVFIPTKVGNIMKDDFIDTWLNSEVLKTLRFGKRKGHCKSCEYKTVCGGCRARAYAYFNDYLAPDPGCINNKEFWKQLKTS